MPGTTISEEIWYSIVVKIRWEDIENFTLNKIYTCDVIGEESSDAMLKRFQGELRMRRNI